MHWYDEIKEEFIKNVAINYMQEISFEPFSIFPVVRTKKRSGVIAKYNKEDWLRIGNINDYKRIGATQSVGDDYDVSSQPYNLEDISFHKDITKTEAEEADSPFDAVGDGTKFVINRMKLIIMSNFVNTYLNTGKWGNDYQGTTDFTKWDDANSTPIDDVLRFQDNIASLTGFTPNRMLITPDVYRVLRSNADIKNSLKVTSDKVVTADALRRLFDMDTLTVMRTVRTTAKKKETATKNNTGYFADKKILLTYAPKNPSKYEPSGGYHLLKPNGGAKGDVAMDRIPMPQNNKALRVEGTATLTPKLIAPDLGCLLYDVIA